MEKKTAENLKVEKFFLEAVRNKTAKEKIKIVGSFYMCAKKLNPQFFVCQKQLKIRKSY